MLSDKQSLILCGITALSIFLFGILEILDNFIVLTFLSIVFLSIIANMLFVHSKSETEDDGEHKNKHDIK
ncbi:hypothetical protein GCM10022395_34990 [Snuella lapsa]|uniref:Uncharacterized protein n=1 Tax=Snuella lapsa TaxID=870481 RepID=A0ABP6YHM4_9FLAO